MSKRTAAHLSACRGPSSICRFLEAEGRDALLAFYRRRTPWHLAEDLAHDAFIKAWSRCSDLRDPNRARPWLFSIAQRHLIDHYRKTALPQSGPSPLEPERLVEEKVAAPADVFRSSLARFLRASLRVLPPEQRSVMTALLEGERQVDIAQRLRLPLSTVKARAQRARQRLYSYLHDRCAFELDTLGRVIDCVPKSPLCCS